ncbi:MAG: hypothetical protein FJY95_13780 [Candidatus Handelsmanbacteria bacterium]|nr:hypothetical protein [Candidatus Handelsmanbacteria bacterium]
MPEPFPVEPLAQAILAPVSLVALDGMTPRQAPYFFDGKERDVLGAVRLRGGRSLLIKGEVAGGPLPPAVSRPKATC